MEKKVTRDVHIGESIARMSCAFFFFSFSLSLSVSLSLSRAFARSIYIMERERVESSCFQAYFCRQRAKRTTHMWGRNFSILISNTKTMGKKQLSGAAKRKKKKEKEEAVKEAAAEIERLKLGPSELWTGLVTHQRDIFVSHVLPKLNETDRCFFGMASDEAKDLLEYAGISNLNLNIFQCASISTMEFMWDHFPWGTRDAEGQVCDQTSFCAGIAQTKKLELMKWLREVKHCEWDEKAIEYAIAIGDLEMVKYCYSNGCPYDVEELRRRGVRFGHLDCLRFLFDNVIPPSRLQHMEQEVAIDAAGYGHIDILKYLVEERKISEEQKFGCAGCIIGKGNFECLKYLVEEARLPLHWTYIASARYAGQTECLNYLREKGCPEPSDEQSARYLEKMRNSD